MLAFACYLQFRTQVLVGSKKVLYWCFSSLVSVIQSRILLLWLYIVGRYNSSLLWPQKVGRPKLPLPSCLLRPCLCLNIFLHHCILYITTVIPACWVGRGEGGGQVRGWEWGLNYKYFSRKNSQRTEVYQPRISEATLVHNSDCEISCWTFQLVIAKGLLSNIIIIIILRECSYMHNN